MAQVIETYNKLIVDEVPYQAYNEMSTTQKGQLGARKVYSDGRVYRYAATDADITIAHAVISTPAVQAIAATYFGADSSTAPIAGEGGGVGDNVIRLTDDVTGVTLDEYSGGYLFIYVSTSVTSGGEGQMFRIEKNEATTTDGEGFLVTLYKPGLAVVLTQTSAGAMIANPWGDMALPGATAQNAAQTAVVKGIAACTTTAATNSRNEYFFVQTHGISLLCSDDGLVGIGEQVGVAVDDTGSGEELVDAAGTAALIHQCIGVGVDTSVDTEYFPIELTLGLGTP